MNEAISKMLERYNCHGVDDQIHALREILQEVALLGLWRAKFFERAAFYGGTAMRILHGLDRFSEDLDFTLLGPNPEFKLDAYFDALRREIGSFGFDVELSLKEKVRESQIQSAFLKANTLRHLMIITETAGSPPAVHAGQLIKIRLEIDTDPPQGFDTETHFLLQPIPFSVKACALPDLFAGKMHALLCRQWRSRVKGRDWYDFVWFVGHHPQLHLKHLEHRMRQSGHLESSEELDGERFLSLLRAFIENLDVEQARKEVMPFVRDARALEVWSKEFFLEIAGRVELA